MSPDELDKLWGEAMWDLARFVHAVYVAAPRAEQRLLKALAEELPNRPRPSGWGERKDDE